MMKTIIDNRYAKNYTFILILFPSTLLAGYGSGVLKITESGVKGFYEYLQGRKGPPMRAVVTSN